jgi:hypothetical protein
MSDLEPFPELIEDEVASLQNVLGAYLIDQDGTIRDPEIAFARIEHADPLPRQPSVRPGGGRLEPGDAAPERALSGHGPPAWAGVRSVPACERHRAESALRVRWHGQLEVVNT